MQRGMANHMNTSRRAAHACLLGCPCIGWYARLAVLLPAALTPVTAGAAAAALQQRVALSACFPSAVCWRLQVRSAGKFPVFVKEAKGAHFQSVDGHQYIDFCLGDTGAMAGHAPEPVSQVPAGPTMLFTPQSHRISAHHVLFSSPGSRLHTTSRVLAKCCPV